MRFSTSSTPAGSGLVSAAPVSAYLSLAIAAAVARPCPATSPIASTVLPSSIGNAWYQSPPTPAHCSAAR